MDSSADLYLLRKYYFALWPNDPSTIPSPPFPSPEFLSLPDTQQWLVDNLLDVENKWKTIYNTSESLDVLAGEGSYRWRRRFWRRVMDDIEEGFKTRESQGEDVTDEEINSAILEKLARCMLTPPGAAEANVGYAPPPTTTKTYFYGPIQNMDEWSCVHVKEDGSFVSGGLTGLKTWKASIALSNHILSDPSLLSSQDTIVELGAGTGLLSQVCASVVFKKQYSNQIYATDHDEVVLEQLEHNIKQSQGSVRIDVTKLDWEWATSEQGFEKIRKNYDVGKESILILGADLIFADVLLEPLAATLAAFLTRSNDKSTAFIAQTIRNPDTFSAFVVCCQKRKLRVDEVELKTPDLDGIVGGGDWGDREGPIKLFRISGEGT